MRYLLFATIVFALPGCGSHEVLDPLPASSIAAVDFSGNWILASDSAAERKIIDAAIRNAAAGRSTQASSSGRNQSSGGRNKSSGGLVQVFLETGKNLKITQTQDGMFLSFDRSIVEEYRFGENRIISVGAISAQRVSGWEDDQYVVRSLDKNGMKLTERLWLAENHNILYRQFVFRDNKDREVVAGQTYQRKQD